jgi:hypothetical protein
MRRVATSCVLVCALVSIGDAADILSQLGITLDAARQAIGTVLNSGVSNPGVPAAAFKLMTPSARGAAATAGMAWLKSYTASADFKQQYASLRDNRKPPAPQFTGTPEDELKKAVGQQTQQSEESKKAIASLPAEQRRQIEEAMKAAEALTAQANTPEMRKMRLDGIKAQRAQRTTQYEQELANWKRDFPETPGPLIARRLREFLAASAGVDYAATVTPRGGRLVFTNPAYEQKPDQWKLCYRAGKDATEAARAAAQSWLKELGG